VLVTNNRVPSGESTTGRTGPLSNSRKEGAAIADRDTSDKNPTSQTARFMGFSLTMNGKPAPTARRADLWAEAPFPPAALVIHRTHAGMGVKSGSYGWATRPRGPVAHPLRRRRADDPPARSRAAGRTCRGRCGRGRRARAGPLDGRPPGALPRGARHERALP